MYNAFNMWVIVRNFQNPKLQNSNFKTYSTVKPVLSGHLKIDKTKVLMENGSLKKVESIAEFCNTFDLH